MTTTTHTLSNGQQVWLCTFTGEVLDHHRTSRLSVSQQASTVLSSTMVIPGRIRAETHSDHDVWLRAIDGREQSVRMTGIPLALRPGHIVTVLWGSTSDNETGGYFAGRNHTTDEVRADVLALGAELRAWRLKVGASASLFRWVMVTALFCGALGFMVSSGGLADRFSLALGGAVVGAVLGFAAWALIGSNLGPERRARAIADEINDLAQRTLNAIE